MPKGVEHGVCFGFCLVYGQVKTAVMPKGVEHVGTYPPARACPKSVKTAVMPKGVEHYSCPV